LGIALAVLVILLAGSGWFFGFRGRGETLDSVAVLPFVNAGGDPNAEYLSDGITESLINSLSQLPHLKVMSRDSAFMFKGKDTDAQVVGRQLGVRAVFKGRVMQRGDDLEISAELVDARDNSHIWGQQYSRKASDIFALQGDLAKEMTTALRMRLTGEDEKRMQFLAYRICLTSDTLHESALITALADGKDGDLDCQLEVTDVISAPLVEPPLDMEFRPAESKGQPNKKHHAVLYVNLVEVPLGRRIEVSVVKSQGAITLIDENDKKSDSVTVQLEKKHQIPDSNVARIPIPWSGTGWGQFARIMAETKTPARKVVTAVATLILDQQDEGGLIKDVKYRPLGNQKCSDLVDGVIYVNSDHSLNRAVFGATQEDYAKRMDSDRTAQYRLCAVITEQSVYRLAEDLVFKNKLLLVPTAPVTSMREFVDAKTHEFAPKLLKILVTAD
jgi:TolB-like protein